MRRLAFLLLLVSAARASDEIVVEREADAVIIRSPIAQANFLFRAPAAFAQVEPPEGFAVALEARAGDGPAAVIRLRLADAPPTLDKLVEARRKEAGADATVSGAGNRRLVTARDAKHVRHVLLLADGPRLYELFLEAPADHPQAAELQRVAEGFTILDPKGAPAAGVPTGGDYAAEEVEHDYYRLKLLKPEGFLRQEVDPNTDEGIFLHLRREDAENRCDIEVRVHLDRALKRSTAELAQERLDAFRKKYPGAKGPKKPQRTSWPQAEEAWKFKVAGMATKGGVVEEDWRIIQHSNARVYEIVVTTWGGASRTWKKDIAAFWRQLRIQPK